VCGNRVLRRIFGPKWDEVTGEWWKLHIEELHILHTSPNIIRHIKSRRMRWAGHVEDQGIDWRFGSEWILGKLAGECRLDPVGSGLVPVAASFVHTVMNRRVLAPRS
jgi:hypothetical protein